MKKRSFSQKLDKFVSGKGFYIALFVCVAIIGVTSWALLFSGNLAGGGDTGAMNTESVSAGGDILPDEPDTSAAVSQDNESALTPESSAPDESTVAPEVSEQTSSEAPDEKKPVSAEEAVYVWPVTGEVIVGHSMDALVYNMTMADWRTHDGIDISAEKGAAVAAVSDGVVESVYNDDLFGTTVVINHENGLKTVYSNMAATPTVTTGERVTVGKVIGSVGSTAIGEVNEVSHLHFAMVYNGSSADPADYLS